MFDKLRTAVDSAIAKATTKELSDKNLSDAVWSLQMVLIQNDVAVEVAERICALTKEKLIGTRTGRLENLKRLFKNGKGSFDVIIKNALKVMDKTKIKIGTNVDSENAESIPRMLDYLEEVGLKSKITFMRLVQ